MPVQEDFRFSLCASLSHSLHILHILNYIFILFLTGVFLCSLPDPSFAVSPKQNNNHVTFSFVPAFSKECDLKLKGLNIQSANLYTDCVIVDKPKLKYLGNCFENMNLQG